MSVVDLNSGKEIKTDSADKVKLKPAADDPLGIGDLLDHMPEGEDDFIEEITNSDGSHTKKEVHTENGVTKIRITSDSPMGMPMPGGGGDPIMKMIMDDMMKSMMGGSMGGSGTIRIGGGPIGGPSIRVRQ